jgi:uncharacterized protein
MSKFMQVWIDADACPKSIKEILFRAAKRTKISMTFVSNQSLSIPSSPYLHKIQVSQGFDVADNKIVALMQAGDLVITADIPLADAVMTKKGVALNPRGELYTPENIKYRLAMRNLMAELRDNGMVKGGVSSLSTKDLTAFANQLDKFLTKYHLS